MRRVLHLSDSEEAWSLAIDRCAAMRNRSLLLSWWPGALERVRLLLAHEVDVDCQTACDYTPLLIAAQDQQD